jgi:hypothetical protein
MRDYWQFLRAAAERQFHRGRPAYHAALRIVTSDQYRTRPFAAWEGQERTMINVQTLYRKMMGRRRPLNGYERLQLLRKTALLARDLDQPRPAASPSSS